jgi:NADPH:quinone reductase-like Zn-dependent oxidoreductase
VGTFAVQIAKAFGAEVTAVCGPRNLDLARSLGANHVIDYTREDFTRQGRRYDLILAVNGYHPLLACRRVLSPTGTYVLVGASSARLVRAILQAKLLGPLLSRSGGRTMDFMGIARINRRDLSYLAELHAAGTIAAVIDRRYPLAEAVEAFRYVEGSHGRGKVVLTVEPGSRG